MNFYEADESRQGIRTAIDDGHWWVLALPITQDNLATYIRDNFYAETAGRLFFDLGLPMYELRVLLCHRDSMTGLELVMSLKHTVGTATPYRDMADRAVKSHITPIHNGPDEGMDMAKRLIDFLCRSGRDPWKPKNPEGHQT